MMLGVFLCFVLQLTSLMIQYKTFCKFIKIYVGYNLRFSKFTPNTLTSRLIQAVRKINS